MFGLGFSELLLIMVVILIVFGPEKLPEIARNVGRATGQFRRTMDEFKHEINLAEIDSRIPPVTERLGCEADRLTTTPFGSDRTAAAAIIEPPAAAVESTQPEAGIDPAPAAQPADFAALPPETPKAEG